MEAIWDNSKTDRKDIVCEDETWIKLVQDRLQWRILVSVIFNLIDSDTVV
jgi:hypothetical protein